MVSVIHYSNRNMDVYNWIKKTSRVAFSPQHPLASYLSFISILFLMHMFSCCPKMQKSIQLHWVIKKHRKDCFLLLELYLFLPDKTYFSFKICFEKLQLFSFKSLRDCQIVSENDSEQLQCLQFNELPDWVDTSEQNDQVISLNWMYSRVNIL